jgi:SAM-dependent methyltransferase
MTSEADKYASSYERGRLALISEMLSFGPARAMDIGPQFTVAATSLQSYRFQARLNLAAIGAKSWRRELNSQTSHRVASSRPRRSRCGTLVDRVDAAQSMWNHYLGDVTDDRDATKKRVIAYYDQEAEGYLAQYRSELRDQEFYPANAIRLDMIVKLLRARGCQSVLDVGTGSGGPLLRFLREGFDAIGIDFSPKMVETAKRALADNGEDADRVSLGDVERGDTLPQRSFDAVVATGVFPHNLDDRAAYATVHAHLREDGTAFIEYRNALMSLFSLNRFSEEFFWNDLMSGDSLPPALRESARELLAHKFDTPVANIGRPRRIEYGDILARFHNPLTLDRELRDHSFALQAMHFYHYHCAPPILEKDHKDDFWIASLGMERPNDWRGLFLASAFVAEMRPVDG